MSQAYRERVYRSQDDLKLYYRDYGDPESGRTPLLCLTGLTRNAIDYDRLATRLSVERRVLCPDYRGRGRSEYDPDWRNYRPETYLNDIRHLLIAANVQEVVVIGTSLGGILGMALGALLPAALAGVVLNDIGPEVEPTGLGRILDYIAADHPQPDWPQAIAFLKTVFKFGLTAEDEWQRLAEGTYRRGADGQLHYDWDIAIAKPLAASRGKLPDLWPLFRSLRNQPVLAVRGALSDVLRANTLQRMAEEKPDLARITIPDIGHAPSLDEPAARAALDAFLAPL